MFRRTRPLLPLFGLPLLLALAGCDRAEKAPAQAGRPVQVVKVEASLLTAGVELSGEIQAEKTVSLAFRIAGRIAERPVNVGDRVTPGQIVARLDRTIETNAVAAAEAALEAARGEVVTARSTFERQERLMGQGFTTRPRFDAAQKAQETAQAALKNAEAQLEQARDRLGFTDLRADVTGVVTLRSAEPGEVVQPGQAVLQIAREDGRDAVFAVPARLLEGKTGDPLVRVVLAEAPGISASGRIREIAPQADPVTRTFQVRVGLQDPPEAMRLGSTVVGSVETTSSIIMSIPAKALTRSGASPAVWIVDPKTSTVSLRPIDILRFDPDHVVVSQGLAPGETIVAAGVQALHPGQRVAPLPPARSAATAADRAPG
ncbi:efflux RND transporter periplasmic adaptor subunit [Bosea sp. (in: a-proteobacteria)]|uniref:efflux RND transporter periplasmic adaptor subunit n=1 Tax=Bosea sp. (in: a-proteobacteria) TaxID=1871050 RepID=UPI0027329698|nr:efflux RND transporter periplasmic adaptor subunit [Bosea sp. (in: a-proteobacteria)]MDP3257414.1 efflux RND transporter periplasmic adaptor subunit [Bosea sp. (in: a-proteobacteria)]